MTPTCKACGREVVWATTSTGGKVALDARSHPQGFIVLDQFGCTGPLHPGGRPGPTRFLPHRLTCEANDPERRSS